jgi:hypothetical protein
MFAARGRAFTIEQLMSETGIEFDHPNRTGALTQAAAKAGLIHKIGYAPARRASRAGGIVAIWSGDFPASVGEFK